MLANQPVKDSEGNYVALFPFDYLYVTQTWGAGTYSHEHHQSDWVGTAPAYPYYAFAPMTAQFITEYGVVWKTDEPVVTRQGLATVLLWVAHDAHVFSVGDHVNAGDVLGHTGARGPDYLTGDHCHLDVAIGNAVAWTPDGSALLNDIRPDELFYLTGDETIANIMADGITLTFATWDKPIPSKTRRMPLWMYLLPYRRQ